MNTYENISIQEILQLHAKDILQSHGMEKEKSYFHHGTVTCYDHSVSVAIMSLRIATFFRIQVNQKSLLRGALLHDYYLYDWHKPDTYHYQGLHGFQHARIALKNAEKDFLLDDIQRDIISKHMFPLNPALPTYRETIIVTISDKICATKETVNGMLRKRMLMGGKI